MENKKESKENKKLKREENLRPFNTLPPEKAKEIRKKGALAAAEAKNKKKTFKEIMEWLGSRPATDQEKANFANIFPNIDEEVTKNVLVAAAQYHKAINRLDTKAATFIRDTAGQKPDTVITGTVTTEKIFITPEEKKATLDHIKEVIADGNDGNK